MKKVILLIALLSPVFSAFADIDICPSTHTQQFEDLNLGKSSFIVHKGIRYTPEAGSEIACCKSCNKSLRFTAAYYLHAIKRIRCLYNFSGAAGLEFSLISEPVHVETLPIQGEAIFVGNNSWLGGDKPWTKVVGGERCWGEGINSDMCRVKRLSN